MAKCKCGCGETVNKTWVRGHSRRKISEATRRKMYEARTNNPNVYGENHGAAILIERDVLDIRFLYKEELKRRRSEGKKNVAKGFRQELSEYYDVSGTQISIIGHHREWKYLDN